MKILDIGCGPWKYPGALGMDIKPLPGVDFVHDMTNVPWPINDESFDRVRMSHSLEHVPGSSFIPVVEEVWRILKPGGRLVVLAPHGFNFWRDPTHQTRILFYTWKYFDPEFDLHFYTKACFKLIDWGVYGSPGDAALTRLYKRWPMFMEKAMFFIDSNVWFVLQKTPC